MSLVLLPRQIVIDQNGKPRVGAKMYLYDAGTSNPRVSYTTPDFDIPHTHPILSPGNGYFPAAYVDAALGDYKLLITDQNGVTVWNEPRVPVRDRDFDAQSVGAALYPITSAESAAGVTPSNFAYEPYNVLRYGCFADKVTDCLAGLERAKAVCVYSRKIYIPAAPAGAFYRLSSTWTLNDLPHGTVICGDGIASLLLIANGSGFNAITVDGCIHLRIRDIGICGILNSGNGLEFINSSHHCEVINVYSSWVGAACFKVTEGISINFENCRADRNIGFRPAELAGTGFTEGTPTHGLFVPGHAGGLNNNISCTDCQFNASGSTYSVQVGTSGATPVQSFQFRGGLIQGSSNHRELFLCTKDSVVSCHIEPPVGASTNYAVTIDSCVNTEISDCVIAGDVQLVGANSNIRLKGITGCGVDIGTNCVRTVLEDFEEANIQTGPAGGKIKDRGTFTTLKRIKNASNERFCAGDGLASSTVYYQTDMENWVGGGSPTVPCGFTALGAPTITRETGVIRTGTYSAKVVMSADLTQGIAITLEPVNAFKGRMIVVEAWVRNLTTAGLARIGMVEGGTGAAVYQPSYQADVWERIQVTFVPNTSATDVTIRLTGLTGTVYWDDIRVSVENYTHKKEMTLDGTTTPSVSYGGYPVSLLVTSGTPTITSFLNPHVGVPFLIRGTGATVVTDGGSIKLAGSGNFTFAAGDQLELVYGSDGIFTEVGRTVV